jgi:hypothetical protein
MTTERLNMKLIPLVLCLGAASLLPAFTQPSLTIYNQNFAVVRDTVPLDLKSGENDVRYAGVTAHVEPDSVILRDPAGQTALQILEQNYRNDPISQELLLSLFEGKTIDFQESSLLSGQPGQIIQGKIVRSGYVPHYSALNQYGYAYQQAQMNLAQSSQPVIEVDGKIRFGLPGQPLFPDLGDDTILKPTLDWLIESPQSGHLDAEISYVSGGFNWNASYNLVSPEKGDDVDLIGWVTMDNQSGKTFENAKIKLMAGDVNKIQQNFGGGGGGGVGYINTYAMEAFPGQPPVSEKSFDDYHLYTLERPTTLRDRETKQVEFVRASGIKTRTVYVYDGATIDQNRYNGWGYENIRTERDYGTQSNKKVWVMREFVNAETNHLGMALPKGKLRFYRRDADGQMEFVGEDEIDHTPRDETIRVNTGNAFDLVGERKQTNYNLHQNGSSATLDESFEIKLRNHKKEPVEIRVVEHLYRWPNWEITDHSNAFAKKDANMIEFRAQLQSDEEKTLTYTVHYEW